MKSGYLKYIFIALMIVFLIAAAFMFMELWERNQNVYPEKSLEDEYITLDGKKYVFKDDVESFLVLGLDKNDGASSSDSHSGGTVQADFLMLFVYDNNSKTVSALQINRDTITDVNRLAIGGDVIGTEKKQIALAYNYAYDDSGKQNCSNTAEAVSELLKGVNVNHYVSFTMDSVSILNDLAGGVEVTCLDDFSGIDDSLKKGEKVTLTGEKALTYVRTRYGLEDSSNLSRMKRQQQYVEALYEKMFARINSDDSFVVELVDTMDDHVVYDSTDYKMKQYIEKFDEYDFLGINELEGETKLGEEFVEFYPDQESLLKLVVELFCEPKA